MIINPPISKKIKDVIKKNIKFSIFVHEYPDPDALGSATALAASLKLTNKQVKIFGINNNIPQKYRELFELVNEPIHEPYINNSVAIILDTANKKRILAFDDRFIFKNIIRIDHHLLVEKIGDLEWVDSTASATCEMVGWFLLENKLPINSKILGFLYAGLLTDTGKFMFPNVSQSTYELLSEFASLGFDKQIVQEKLFLNDLSDVKLENKLRKKIKITDNGIGYIIVDKRTSLKYSNKLNDKVWLLSGIKQVKVWFFIYYNEEKGCWKGSIRSRQYNVNEIAKIFGGGGHLLASGFTLNNKQDIKKLISEINKVISNEK